MSRAIADYGLIGDTHSTALVHRDGSIDWLCWPHHDSPALFTRLLDEADGGRATVEFDGLAPISRRYVDETNILETRFGGEDGSVDLHDLMPVHPPATRSDEGPDGDAQSRVLRLLTCRTGTAAGTFRVRLTPGYGRQSVRFAPDGDRLRAESEALSLHLAGSHPIELEGDVALMRFALREGEQAFLVLGHDAGREVGFVETLDDAQADFRHTRNYWSAWSATLSYDGAFRDAVVRSALILKLLTYSPTGAIVAAATTSLPEAVPGNRNYDYRYSWIRDASFTMTAFCNLGLLREAEEYLRFLRNADRTKGRELKLLYAIEGEVPEEQELENLPGWRGVKPVRIGNAAEGQQQHDIYGEFLLALHAYLDAVDFRPPPAILDGLPELVETLADHAVRCRDLPDQGIWEIRGEAQHLQHSKALIWVALDRACIIADRLNAAPPEKRRRWRSVADELRPEYEARSWNERRGAYMQAYGSEILDAAVLRTILFGALDPHDPRTRSTMEAVTRELTESDLVYRYHMADGLEGEEATFTACAFWRVGAMAIGGDGDEARALFERLLARGNDLGLFAEEIDVATGEQRGNVPQGFTHMAIINHAIRVDSSARDGLRAVRSSS